MNRAKIFAGVFLVTMSVLMLQLGLTWLFSATMYYHFAFLVISLALLGSGASGVFVYIYQRKLSPDRTGLWLSRAALLFSFATLFALYVVLNHPLLLEPGPGNYYRLAKIYGATSCRSSSPGAWSRSRSRASPRTSADSTCSISPARPSAACC